MKRRSVLRALGMGAVASVGGCISDGRVVVEQQKTVRIQPESAWSRAITEFSGKGAIQYTVTARRRFDVYYFTSDAAYGHYRTYLAGGTPTETPRGHADLSKAAIETDTGEYAIEVPVGGGRQPVDADGTHHFVVDHSSYGRGIPVGDTAAPLDASIHLRVIDRQLPI